MNPRWETALAVAALAPLAFLHDRLRELVQGSMVLHMALQFPLLLLAGACAANLLARRWPTLRATWERIDRDGLLATIWLSGVTGLWMVPAALDAALLDPVMAFWKYSSWCLAGWCVALAWPGMASAMRLFLLGNLAWMTLTTGLLYADAEQRLCVSYLFDEQAWTGRALCIAALLLLGGLVREATRMPVQPAQITASGTNPSVP